MTGMEWESDLKTAIGFYNVTSLLTSQIYLDLRDCIKGLLKVFCVLSSGITFNLKRHKVELNSLDDVNMLACLTKMSRLV